MTSQSARRRGKKSGCEVSQKDDWIDAPKSKEIKQKGIIEKGPRVQDDAISVAENMIEENKQVGIILQNKCHKSKSVDKNHKSSTSQSQQQKQKPTKKTQETTDLYVQKGNCSVDMLSTSSCPPDVSINQSTKQNLLVERPNQDGITSSAEDLINENPPIGKNSQDEYTRFKSNDSNHSSTTKEVCLEMQILPSLQNQQNQQMPNTTQQKKRIGKENQQYSTEKINKKDDIVFPNKNDLTNVNCENDPKNVDENDHLSAGECDDDVDDVTPRNDSENETVQILKSDGTSIQDQNAIADKDTVTNQHDAESDTLGMVNPEQTVHENTDQGNMILA